jgi:hypothetical protein
VGGKRTTLEIKIEDEDGDKIRMDEEEKGSWEDCMQERGDQKGRSTWVFES